MLTLLSVSSLIPVIWLAYTMKAWWEVRADWHLYAAETKTFYLIVAPPITFALDIFVLSDRLLYSPRNGVA